APSQRARPSLDLFRLRAMAHVPDDPINSSHPDGSAHAENVAAEHLKILARNASTEGRACVEGSSKNGEEASDPSGASEMSTIWYAVEIFMRSSRNDDKEPLWQQNVYLVSATDVAAAEAKGNELGRQAEHEYVTVGGTKVNWHFVKVS